MHVRKKNESLEDQGIYILDDSKVYTYTICIGAQNSEEIFEMEETLEVIHSDQTP